MTTRFKTSLAAGIAALTLAVAAPVFVAAQQDPQPRRQGPGFGGPPPGGGPGMGMRMRGPGGPFGFGPGFGQLDLSEDQKAQLKQIAESHRDEFRALGDKARAAHDGMQALIDAEQIDENAIRAKSQEIAAADASVMILNARVRQQSMQVLTSEQQAKLKELREQHQGPRQRRGQQQKQQF